MKTLFTVVFILSFLSNIQATKLIPDITRPRKPWKISKQEFLDKYGKDDTSRIIIQHYFFQHKKGITEFITFPLITTANSILYSRLAMGVPVATALIWVPIFVLGAIISGTLLIGWISNLTSFSRKRLLNTLTGYLSGKGIPRSLKKIFKPKYSSFYKR